MIEFSDALSKWFAKQPKWLLCAAKRLLEKNETEFDDILEFFELCQQEAKGHVVNLNGDFSINAFAIQSTSNIRLILLNNIIEINALAPRSPLDFGKNDLTVKVELTKCKVSKSKILHRIQLKNTLNGSLTEVISEGEKRIIAIAAFLANVTSKNFQSSFIFDDSIYLLDQNYEEAVIKSLIALSSERKVIIFTHRSSFFSPIHKFSKSETLPINIQEIQTTEWGRGELLPMLVLQG